MNRKVKIIAIMCITIIMVVIVVLTSILAHFTSGEQGMLDVSIITGGVTAIANIAMKKEGK